MAQSSTTSPTDVFNWCFIGTGSLANTVAKQILKTGRHKIVSVYSRRMESASKFVKKHGGQAFSTPQEALNMAGVDGVYIVTPHNSHFEYARMALELGIPVLLEKPFTVRANEADYLIKLSKEKGVYLAEAMWTWFSPVAHQVYKWIHSGELGEINSAKLTYHMKILGFSSRLTDPNRAGGALLDIGVYPITYLYRLFGKPDKIVCNGKVENGIDVSEDVELTFPGGLCALASISMADFKGLEKLSITGQAGEISGSMYHMTNKIKLIRKDSSAEVFEGDGSYLNEFDCVAKEIRAGLLESSLVPLSATSDVMHILDECRKQMGLVYPFEK